ncbi:SRPBCC family protein [Nocardia sp. NPDC004278]
MNAVESRDLAAPLNQIAFSVVDLRRTERWFREGFGLLPAGGSRRMMRGILAARVQGLPRAASTCWWLVGRNPWFQLELFQFERPIARPMPADFRPCDIGYTRIGIWVADFDATLANLARLDTVPLTPPLGEPGVRRACVRNPDGVYVEIMEDDPLAGQVGGERLQCPAAIRSVTLSVPDLGSSADFLRHGIALAESSIALHTPQHEALWGLAGASTRTKIFLAGDVLVETVQYLDPVGKPRPAGYRISDQGILNIAFGARNKRDHINVYERAVAAGADPNCKPVHLPGAGVVYVNDAQGFSFEILWMRPGLSDRLWGFAPRPTQRRPDPDTHTLEQNIYLAAPPAQVWAVLADHEGMAAWSGFTDVRLTAAGSGQRGGYGAQRLMKGPLGTMREEVTAWQPPRTYRYRVVEGSPVVCHQGQITLTPRGSGTQLRWTIRFRPRLILTGALLRRVLETKLGAALRDGLKPLIEGESK